VAGDPHEQCVVGLHIFGMHRPWMALVYYRQFVV
jgi:hypothetical protein